MVENDFGEKLLQWNIEFLREGNQCVGVKSDNFHGIPPLISEFP